MNCGAAKHFESTPAIPCPFRLEEIRMTRQKWRQGSRPHEGRQDQSYSSQRGLYVPPPAWRFGWATQDSALNDQWSLWPDNGNLRVGVPINWWERDGRRNTRSRTACRLADEISSESSVWEGGVDGLGVFPPSALTKKHTWAFKMWRAYSDRSSW